MFQPTPRPPGLRAARSLLIPGPLVVALVLPAGCGVRTQEQQMRLDAGQQAYRSRQYEPAIRELTAFLQNARDDPAIAEASYVRGMSHARLSRRAEAYADLRRAATRADDKDVRWRANVALGSMHYDDGDWSGAVAAYTTAVPLMPVAAPLDVVLYRTAQCYQRLGRPSASLDYWRRVGALFPRSELAESAARALASQASEFMIQCGVFGQTRNAENLAASLRKAGFPTVIRPETRGGKAAGVVYVGPFRTYSEAEANVRRVRQYVADASVWP